MKQKGIAFLLPMAALSGLCTGLVVGLFFIKGGEDFEHKKENIPKAKDIAKLKKTSVANEVAAPDNKASIKDGDLPEEKSITKRNVFQNLKIKFDISPSTARKKAKIRVNNIALNGFEYDLVRTSLKPIKLRVLVEATGYETYRDALEISENQKIVLNLKVRREKTDKKKDSFSEKQNEKKIEKQNEKKIEKKDKQNQNNKKQDTSSSKKTQGPGGLIDL